MFLYNDTFKPPISSILVTSFVNPASIAGVTLTVCELYKNHKEQNFPHFFLSSQITIQLLNKIMKLSVKTQTIA
jgi:hypothetical protein